MRARQGQERGEVCWGGSCHRAAAEVVDADGARTMGARLAASGWHSSKPCAPASAHCAPACCCLCCHIPQVIPILATAYTCQVRRGAHDRGAVLDSQHGPWRSSCQ